MQSKGLEMIVYVEDWLAVADVQWHSGSTGRQDEIDKVSDVSRELIEMVGGSSSDCLRLRRND